MGIRFEDKDIAEINMKVAEQCLIKASVEDERDIRVKSLLLAKQSINNALKSLNFDNSEFEIKRGSSQDETNHHKKQSPKTN